MSFLPIIPTTGLNGWQFLQRSMSKQAASHASTTAALRDDAYFRQNIGKIASAEELVNDRRLLRVALSAFGLAEDLPNRAFIQRVLESPTGEQLPGEERSFVQRLTDRRYHDLAAAFGFGDRPKADTQSSDSQFTARQADASTATRLASSMQRDLSALASSGIGDEATWTIVLNTPSLRSMFETAYDLPDDFGSLGLDGQIMVMQSKTEALFGTGAAAHFAEEDALNILSQRYIDRFAGALLGNFHARQFEEAVGEQNQSMRLAMALQRDLSQLAGSDQSESGKWFRILGTPSMRQVFETAFQLPSSFGSLDLDRQVEILSARTHRLFGEKEVSQFSDPAKLDALIRRFFIGEQLSDIQSTTTQSAALVLLQNGQANLAAMRRR